MNDFRDDTSNFASQRTDGRLVLLSLLCFHIVACCLSLVYVAEYYGYLNIVAFDRARAYETALLVVPYAVVSFGFVLSRFSFGYFVGFYLYSVILGYLWIAPFSAFQYDHRLTAISAFASALAFLIPALSITSAFRQRLVLSERALEYLLHAVLLLSASIIAMGVLYNFRLVGIDNIYKFREEAELPAFLNYSIGMISNALLPFAFACYVVRQKTILAAVSVTLMLLIYPITLTKLALLAPFWLLFLLVLSKFFEARIAIVSSLLLPIAAGIFAVVLFKAGALSYPWFIDYFGVVNFRMIAFPSISLDIYNDYFSTHSLTYFCQISFLRSFVACPYNEQLSIVMAKAYQLGNLNASMFATEGIASVGPFLAPLTLLGCGLVISLANRASSGLPSNFVLLSGGVLPQIFLNVPLSTTLLTNGAAVLFLLWYVTPRGMFEEKAGKPIGAAHLIGKKPTNPRTIGTISRFVQLLTIQIGPTITRRQQKNDSMKHGRTVRLARI
jgi:hypothetical protein